jgi:cell division protein FtsQ
VETRWSFVSTLVWLVAEALLLTARLLYVYISDVDRFPIHTIKIEASYQHITHQEVEAVLHPFMEASFFSLSIHRLQEKLRNIAWVKNVLIERIWPDTLKIRIEEKVPIATWNGQWITRDGEIFGKNDKNAHPWLPVLQGPKNAEVEILEAYKKIHKILKKHGLQAARLERYPNQSWELQLSNGVLLHLGSDFLESRMTRFCKAYPAVFGARPEQVISVDLRYPRGMAVRWK